VKELPSTNPKPEECAKVWEGHTSLFTGVDLTGWTTEKDSWKAGGGVLRCVGKEPISTEKKFGSVELIFDWKRPAKSDGKYKIEVGGIGFDQDEKPGAWHRAVVRHRTNAPAPITLPAADGLEVMNVFARELKEKE
jgi:hypothetical protein